MPIPKFKKIISIAAPLAMDDIDTDQIYPARFLTTIERNKACSHLFEDCRCIKDGARNMDFVLNKPEYQKSRILLARKNFGCGSSREHAAWAIFDSGFRAVIASSFGDIFKHNALKNGLLPIELPLKLIERLENLCKKEPPVITIDLRQQTIAWKNEMSRFSIDKFSKKCLLEGLDDIEYILQFKKEIIAYEKNNQSKYESY